MPLYNAWYSWPFPFPGLENELLKITKRVFIVLDLDQGIIEVSPDQLFNVVPALENERDFSPGSFCPKEGKTLSP
jgi:hypothetical protein